MTATTTLPVLFATGIHSARPAASAVGAGGLYSCTTHSLVYQTDGSSWTTWANLAGTGGTGTVTTVEEVDGSPTDSAVTKIVFPNGTLGIASHVATYTPATNIGKGCILYHTANQSIGSSSVTALAWDTEETDTDSFHDTSTNNNRITIPTGLGGLYLVNINLLWGTRSEDFAVGVQLKKNGTTVLRGGGLDRPSGNSNTTHSLSTLVRLAQADYIEVLAINNTSGAINVIAGQTNTTFEIAYLSA